MAEAERARSAQTVSELPAKSAENCHDSTPREEQRLHDEIHHSRWKKAPWLATLGATFGFLIGSGLYRELHSEDQHFGEFLLIAIIIGTGAYWFFDPLMELIRGGLGATPPSVGPGGFGSGSGGRWAWGLSWSRIPACTGEACRLKACSISSRSAPGSTNTVEHTAAVPQASGVRGVWQIVDQIQVSPPARAMPKGVVVPPPPPLIHANIWLFKSPPRSQGHPTTPKSPKSGTTSQPKEATKGSFFHPRFGRN